MPASTQILRKPRLFSTGFATQSRRATSKTSSIASAAIATAGTRLGGKDPVGIGAAMRSGVAWVGAAAMAGRAGSLLVIGKASIRATTPHAGLWRLALREAALAPGLEQALEQGLEQGLEQALAAAREAVIQESGRQESGQALAMAACPEAAVTEAAVQCEAAAPLSAVQVVAPAQAAPGVALAAGAEAPAANADGTCRRRSLSPAPNRERMSRECARQ